MTIARMIGSLSSGITPFAVNYEKIRNHFREMATNIYVVVYFLSQGIFVFLLFLGMIMYANEVETKEK